MNQELAQKLKDAGFPQDKSKTILRKYSLADEPIELPRPPTGLDVIVLSGKTEWELAYPTLEELLEACGSKFISLKLITDSDDQVFWFATGIQSEGETSYQEISNKPIISVANLWIKINRKL